MAGYIFTSAKGQALNQQLNVVWGRALKRAGVRHRPSYQLRHTWASMALEAGESPAWVASMLGHTTMEMVKIYLSIAQADLERNHQHASPVANWAL